MKRTSLLLALFGFTSFIQAATFTVTTTSDSGVGSLRQAILDANATPGGGSVEFGVTGTITLASALPTITDSVAIIGPGTNFLTVSGSGLVPIFAVSAGTNHSMISGLTIARGRATGYANGAAVFNAGILTIANCALTGNQTSGGWGGALFNSGTLLVIDSTFSTNQVIGENGANWHSGGAGGGGAGMGGAVFTMSGSVALIDCAFFGNSATGGNGGNASGSNGTGRGGGLNGGQAGTINNYNGQAGGYGGGGGGGVYSDGDGGTGGYGGGGGGGADCGVGGGSVFGGGSGGRQFSIGYCYFGGGGGGAGLGGGVFVDSGTVTIVNCTFSGNQVTGGSGGAANQTGPGTAGSGIGVNFFNRAGTILPILTATTLGGGTVTIDPSSPPYLNNSQATVTASPAPGWAFLHWLGDASDTNPIVSLNVTRNKCVQAVFGTQFSAPALISVNPQTDLYPYGTVVKVTALPPAGTYFASWSGAATGTNNPLSIAVTNANQSISAQFGTLSAGQFALTVIEDGGGHVGINPLTSTYTDGQSATLTAVPDTGQEFVGWSGDATGTNNPLVVTMSSSKSITAIFTKRPHLKVGTCLEGLVEDGFRLTLMGEFGQEYEILGSTNFLDWLAAGTVTNVYGTSLFTDPAGTNLPQRFYRAESIAP